MDEQKARDIMSGRQQGLASSLLRAGLTAASWPYAGAMRLRRWTYRIGLRKSHAATVPVICVGNITTGGTGKTPMVAWVVAQLQAAGKTPAILTRGYRAVNGKSDEAELLKSITGAPVIVNPDRVTGARAAVSQGADVIVMDDGFQHRRLRRDMDIVLVDATNPFGYDHCLPRGLLREPPAALREAAAVVITRSDAAEPEQISALREKLTSLAPQASIHTAIHRPVAVIDENATRQELSILTGRKVCAFCGLGNPGHFFRMLGELGARLVSTQTFDDHAEYTPQVIDSLRRTAENCDAEIFITTQKDAVKLTDTELALPVWKLAIEIEITNADGSLTGLVLAAANKRSA